MSVTDRERALAYFERQLKMAKRLNDDEKEHLQEAVNALRRSQDHSAIQRRLNAVMSLLRQAHAWISEDTEALQASHMPYNDTDPVDIEVRAEVDARKAWLAAFQPTSKAEPK